MMKITIVAIAGASGSGKTTITNALVNRYTEKGVKVLKISVDNYYRKDLAPDTNWDEPQSVELELLRSHLLDLINGKSIEMPTYCFSPPNRLNETIKINPTDDMVVVVEGIFALHSELTESVEMVKVYVDTPLDISAIWRLLRDERENRGRTLAQGVESYLNNVRPMFLQHIAPTQHVADLSVQGSEPAHVDKIMQLISLKQSAHNVPVSPVVLESPGSLGMFHHSLPGSGEHAAPQAVFQ